jgi:hypothetical protein
MSTDCYKCGYKGNNPGSAHIRCKYDWRKSGLPAPKGKPHGIKCGWWIFPVNFDPVWMIDECPVFGTEWDSKMVIEKYDPLFELGAILSSVGR